MTDGNGASRDMPGAGDGVRLPTLCLVRHAKAYSRRRWTGDDRDRPLTENGREQASLLTDYILASVGRPTRILSSPALRCRETMAPLAARCGLKVDDTAWLDEGSTPDDAFDRLCKLTVRLDAGAGRGPVAASTHGDVMWGILELLVAAGTDLGDRADAPKGGVWIIGLRGDAPPSAVLFVAKVDS